MMLASKAYVKLARRIPLLLLNDLGFRGRHDVTDQQCLNDTAEWETIVRDPDSLRACDIKVVHI